MFSENADLFSSNRSADYLAQWLDDYRTIIALPPVDIADPTALNQQELAELRQRGAVANFTLPLCPTDQRNSRTFTVPSTRAAESTPAWRCFWLETN